MNVVIFPGLGLELNIPRYLLQIGNLKIHMYAFCIVLGIIIGLILARISKEKFDINYDDVLEIVIGSIIFGTIGARVYYVIFNLSIYIQDPLKIFDINSGGLAIYGGIIGILIFILIKCKKDKICFLDVCDYLVPYLALGQSIGRWGNFFNIEAYGEETTSILRMGINTVSGYKEVHPVFLYESICTFLIFIILRIMQKKRIFKGQILYLYFILYGFIRMFLEGFRVDSLWIGDFRVSQVLSLILFVTFLIIYFIKLRKSRKM